MTKLSSKPNSPCADGSITMEFAGILVPKTSDSSPTTKITRLISTETALSVIFAESIVTIKPFGNSIRNTLPLTLIACKDSTLIIVGFPS